VDQGCAEYFFFISVRFQLGLKINSDSVRNKFCSVWFKKRGSVQVLELFTTRVIAEQLIYSKYYSDSGWHDFDVTDVTHNNDNK